MYKPPKATIILNAAPIQVEGDALFAEWVANPEVASARYKLRDVYLKMVTVEEMSIDPAGPFVRSGHAKCFSLSVSDLEKIRIGDPVDIIGRIQGTDGETILLSDCWVRVVDTRKPQGY